MTFIWPRMMLLLAAVPALAFGYAIVLRRRADHAARLDPVGLTTGGLGQRLGRRRHLPMALFLIAVGLLVFGLSRPQLVLALPRQEGTVILAFDNSNSMKASDVAPTRLEAAQDAARQFVDEQPRGVRIGVVAFSGGGVTLQAPTFEQADVLSAIDRVSIEGTTSLGWGIYAALNTVADDPIDLRGDNSSETLDPLQVEIGNFGSAIVVLLTDGEDTSDLDPIDMAIIASNAGVRIFPVGYGGPGAAEIEVDGYTLATVLDEALLTEIADVTDGEYTSAGTEQLGNLYDAVDRQLTVSGEETEVTSLFAGLGALFLLAGGALSMRWLGRMP